MNPFLVKRHKLSGSNYREVLKQAREIYRLAIGKSHRRPYLRSAYFKKEKVFLELFWTHLMEKSFADRTRRLRFFSCALELIQKSRQLPTSKTNVDRKREILHRFCGITKHGEIFFVQIKEDKFTGRKDLVSIFPLK